MCWTDRYVRGEGYTLWSRLYCAIQGALAPNGANAEGHDASPDRDYRCSFWGGGT